MRRTSPVVISRDLVLCDCCDSGTTICPDWDCNNPQHIGLILIHSQCLICRQILQVPLDGNGEDIYDTSNSVRLSQCKASYEKLGRSGITVDSTYGVMGRHVQTRAVHPHLIQKSLFATRGCDTCSSTALGFLSPLFIWVWVLMTSRNLKKSAKLVRLNSVAPYSQHLFKKKNMSLRILGRVHRYRVRTWATPSVPTHLVCLGGDYRIRLLCLSEQPMIAYHRSSRLDWSRSINSAQFSHADPWSCDSVSAIVET